MPRPSLNLPAQNPCLSNPCISICLSESLIYFYQVFPQPPVFQIKQTKCIQSLPVTHNPYSRRHSGQPLLQPFLFHTLPVMGQPRLHTILIHIQLHRDFLTMLNAPIICFLYHYLFALPFSGTYWLGAQDLSLQHVTISTWQGPAFSLFKTILKLMEGRHKMLE